MCGRLVAALPPDAAARTVRDIVTSTGGTVMALLAEEGGVAEYNLFAVFRLHADVAGLQQWADTLKSVPTLRVPPPPPLLSHLLLSGVIKPL